MSAANLTQPSVSAAQPGTHCVILVHGIRTRGYWMQLAKAALHDHGMICETTSYGRFSLLKFVLPLKSFKQQAIDRVIRDVDLAIRLHKPQRISIVAHSFGTWAAANILRQRPDLKFHRVVFCGSVVREDFPIEEIIDRFDGPLLNEVGEKDIWPKIAEMVSSDYGAVGSHGFNRPGVTTRWHEGFRHSDFLTRSFIESQWIPFLKDGTTLEADAPPRSGNAWSLLATGALLAAALAFAYWFFAEPAPDEPDVPTGSFAFFHNNPNDPDPGWRVWSPTGTGNWIEHYPRGNKTSFRIVGKQDYQGCQSVFVTPIGGDPDFQVLIPEKGCGEKSLLFRRGAAPWVRIGSPIQIDRR